MINKEMINRKTWEEFRNSGLLWWINQQLHIFGWSIFVVMEDDKILEAYPARVKFRGFDDNNNTQGYIKVSKYMKENADELLKEAEE